MKISIFTPGHPGPDKKSLPPSLAAPYIAAIAAPYVDEIKIYDLAVEPFDRQAAVPDISLFTTTMAQSDHVFEIARFLKAKGSRIFMGGPHVTLAYNFDNRIKEIADTVILGEAEKALPAALEDLKNGRLKPSYHMDVDSLAGIPFSRLDLLDHKKYYFCTAVIATRGCPNRCTYCSIKNIYGPKYLKRPVDEIIEEIKFQTSRKNVRWVDRKFINFWDDNMAGDIDWYHELLEKMIPLKKYWLSQMCLNVANNKESVRLMKLSGCKGIFVGLESVSKKTLQSQNKLNVNIIDDYTRQAKILLKAGITLCGATMYGFDADTKESLFTDTLKVAERMGLTILQAHIVTPYPHSDYFDTLKKENRLVTENAKYYNGYTVVHKPANIHPAELQEGFINLREKFYSGASILKRMFKHNLTRWPEFLVWNWLFRIPNYKAIPGVNVNQWLAYLKNL